MTVARRPGHHRDPLAVDAVPLSSHRRPAPGPIAVLPHPTAPMTEAIESAGGTVAPLDASTRGIVWLGGSTDELAAILAEHGDIGWVQLPAAGIERHAGVLSRFVDRGLLWTSAKGAYAEPVAEHALALALALLRQVPDKARSTTWQHRAEGLTLYGARVTIIGAGGIAQELLRLLAPFEVDATVVRRGEGALAGARRTVTSAHLDEVLAETDVLVIAAAATPETAQLIGAAQLSALPPTAVLVNIARGALVDTAALLSALESGQLWGVGLDVTDPEPLPDDHPLWSHPRCVVTSHSADTAEMVELLLADRVRHNVTALLGAGDFIGVVDPERGY